VRWQTLVLLWVIGRLGVLLSGEIGALPAVAADLCFPAVFLAVVAREILAGKNWRNLPMLGALSLLLNQWKLICTANVADLLDFFDFFLIGYVTAALTKEWSLPYWQGGAILLASGLGAVPGAFIWGWLGDRIGRRTVFIWSAVTISLATGVMVFTPGPNAVIPGWLFLMFFQVFVGIGNAGIFTIDLPLVQEFIPAYKRLGQCAGHDAAAGRRHAGGPGGLVAAADSRLALPVPGRPVATRAGIHDPLLGAGIAALADPHGAP
jgi:MFS family permease